MTDWLREDLPTALLGAAVTLAWLAVIFVPLEWARPRWSSQPRLRRGLATDLAFFAGQHLVFGALVAWILTRIYGLAPLAALADLQGAFARLPMALQVITALILGDLAMYWAHRAQHRFAWLWRFHAVHHSSEALDFVAAHREHPVDGLYTQFFMNLPAVLLGFSYEAVLGLVAFRGLWATAIHANVRLPLGPLAHLIGSPQFHHLHHLRRRDVGNYANLAPWIDHLFGTHRHGEDDADPSRTLDLGLDSPAPRTYLGLLALPFRRWSDLEGEQVGAPAEPSAPDPGPGIPAGS